MQWITFVGEGRSGHTIISAILGSHPHGRIAEEQKLISRWYRAGWPKDQIFNTVLSSGMGKERKTKGFDEQMVLSHKEPLLYVGDKCGWDAVNEYMKRGAPQDILAQFGTFMQMDIKVIVSLRNPFDNISSWVSSPKYQRIYPDKDYLWKKMAKRYRRFHRHAEEIMKGQDCFIWHNEEAILHPVETIRRLSDWLELPRNEKWVEYCASRMFKKPNDRRNQIEWPDKYVQQTLDFIQESSLMEYYR